MIITDKEGNFLSWDKKFEKFGDRKFKMDINAVEVKAILFVLDGMDMLGITCATIENDNQAACATASWSLERNTLTNLSNLLANLIESW